MKLLPIIYISVALFFVVVVVILIVSYFSYKIKRSNGTDDENEHELELKPLTKTRPSKKTVKKKPRRKSTKEKTPKKKKPSPVYQYLNKKTRLSVLNDSLTKDKEEKILTKSSDSNDLLKSYSDEENDNLFTMKVKKTKRD